MLVFIGQYTLALKLHEILSMDFYGFKSRTTLMFVFPHIKG